VFEIRQWVVGDILLSPEYRRASYREVRLSVGMEFAVQFAFGTACWQLTMPCWARSMRLIYCWHT